MTPDSIKEIYELLERSCLRPMLCDTPVEHAEQGVKAGVPSVPGDATNEYLMLPREIVGRHAVFVIDVIGDSMRDAGIVVGDRLQVEIDARIDDGDIVVACLNGECTVKAFCRDERGNVWLVPRNEDYDAIRVADDADFRIIGKVVGVMKGALRSSYVDMMRTIKRTRGKMDENRVPDVQRVEFAVMRVARIVEHGRQWYAVFRALADRGCLGENDYASFVELVARVVPEHGHLPVASEVRRMAVQSFRKSVALWERGDAPVSGVRYDDYLKIARATLEELKK